MPKKLFVSIYGVVSHVFVSIQDIIDLSKHNDENTVVSNLNSPKTDKQLVNYKTTVRNKIKWFIHLQTHSKTTLN